MSEVLISASLCCICCICILLSLGGIWYADFDKGNNGYLYPECNYGPLWGNIYGAVPLKKNIDVTLSVTTPIKSIYLKEGYKLLVTPKVTLVDDTPPAPSPAPLVYKKSEPCLDVPLKTGDKVKLEVIEKTA